MRIKRLDFSTFSEVQRWDAFAQERGQLYHLSPWAGLFRSVYSFEPVYLFAEEMGKTVSIFPLFRVTRPFGKRELVSIPHVEAGGMVNTEPYRLYLDYLYEKSGGDPIRISQFGEPLGNITANTNEVVMVKELPQKREDILTSIRSSRVRAVMRKSLGLPYQLLIGNDEKIIAAFYSLYLEKMREFGTPPHPLRFFQALKGSFGDAFKVLALRDAERGDVGAGLYIGCAETLNNLFLAVPSRFLKQNAGHFLEYGAMEFGVGSGFTSLVLGRCEKDSGNYSYKFKLNGKAVPLYLYRFEAMADGYREVAERTAKEKYRSMARLWARLPAIFTDHMGPLLRKWIY